MLGIKKLDIYILRKFLPLFVAAFFICLFVFMMQFTWRYLDELVGKGLTLDILAQFFWYMGLTLVPTSMPLAVLLATLITFGNMGEQLELLAMKAAGVSLMRIMRPILLVAILVTGISFHFQNSTSPKAQVNIPLNTAHRGLSCPNSMPSSPPSHHLNICVTVSLFVFPRGKIWV